MEKKTSTIKYENFAQNGPFWRQRLKTCFEEGALHCKYLQYENKAWLRVE